MLTKHWIVASAPLLLATACTCEGTEVRVLEREVARVRAWSLRPGATLVGGPRTSASPSSFEVFWEIRSGESWSNYRAALERALPAGYVRGPASVRDASFRKSLTGDTLYVRIEVVAEGPPLRLQVTFTAHAG